MSPQHFQEHSGTHRLKSFSTQKACCCGGELTEQLRRPEKEPVWGWYIRTQRTRVIVNEEEPLTIPLGPVAYIDLMGNSERSRSSSKHPRAIRHFGAMTSSSTLNLYNEFPMMLAFRPETKRTYIIGMRPKASDGFPCIWCIHHKYKGPDPVCGYTWRCNHRRNPSLTQFCIAPRYPLVFDVNGC